MEHFYDCLTDFIFVKDEPQPSDLIFVPGGDYPEAALHAAELYHEGYATRILPSGRYSKLIGHFSGDPAYETEWDYLHAVLASAGVPDSAILEEKQATYTWENAIYSRMLVEKLNIPVRRAILSCQAFHARRCLMYYKQQFPETKILVCPVETKGITRENWTRERRTIDVVLGEVERCGSQFHEIMEYGSDVWEGFQRV
jgi:uncharacterized SAM-binding protein YcdF (DUF218 family)